MEYSLYYQLLALIFILGTIIGSFLNVVILRHETGESITGRSHCPQCNKTLRWYELIPVLSYLLQKGKCSNCGAPLSIQYPLVEFAAGVVFVCIAVQADATTMLMTQFSLLATIELLLYLAIWSLLIVITVYDLKTKLIPDRFSFTFSGLAFFVALIAALKPDAMYPFYVYLLAGPALFAPFYVLWKVSNGRWIGLGDGKLALGIGWLLEPVAATSAIIFSFWIGAVFSLALIAIQRVASSSSMHPEGLPEERPALTLKSEIPFAPFLVAGTALAFFSGVTFITLFG